MLVLPVSLGLQKDTVFYMLYSEVYNSYVEMYTFTCGQHKIHIYAPASFLMRYNNFNMSVSMWIAHQVHNFLLQHDVPPSSRLPK